MLSFLLFLLFPSVIQTCLVIRYSEPPKCECEWTALTSSNIEEFIGQSSFYIQNITGKEVKAPLSTEDDCSLSIYCDKWSLVIMDKKGFTNNGFTRMLGEYSADALCDPYTQKWRVDNGAELVTYDELYGVCVDYDFETTTTRRTTRRIVTGNNPPRPTINFKRK
ncbi:hypothetical protein GCK72_015249 [Caenorhabditis remanei]|uniref:Uncharacterized protein n=1 Tax=Caenorhabditis remanei TaxID=31234 RepID=A0A6A5GW61_CAERE|nr:hypothetical protein GCK72_015249 [Caenorhabditis remanei]KAF1758789.1 hypothetical protein GCK72_015249 [Caenorhabditis remanei]